MRAPTTREIQRRLGDSYALDLLWRETMGLPPGDTKERPLRAVIDVLEATGTPYALIGGVAMQLHSREPRTTLDTLAEESPESAAAVPELQRRVDRLTRNLLSLGRARGPER